MSRLSRVFTGAAVLFCVLGSGCSRSGAADAGMTQSPAVDLKAAAPAAAVGARVADFTVGHGVEMRGVALVIGDSLFVDSTGRVEFIPGHSDKDANIPRIGKAEPATLAQLAAVLGDPATKALESVPPLGEGGIVFVDIRTAGWQKRLEFATPTPAAAKPLFEALGRLRAYVRAHGTPVAALTDYTVTVGHEQVGARQARHGAVTFHADGQLEYLPANGPLLRTTLPRERLATLSLLLASPALQALDCGQPAGEGAFWLFELKTPERTRKLRCPMPVPRAATLVEHEAWQLRFAANLPED